jgi:hypothetical protein
VVKPYQRKEMIQQLLVMRGVSIRLACHAFKGSEYCYLYQPIMSSQNEEIADWLMQLKSADHPPVLCLTTFCAAFTVGIPKVLPRIADNFCHF